MNAQNVFRKINAHGITLALFAAAIFLTAGCRSPAGSATNLPEPAAADGQTLRIIPESLTTPAATVRLVNADDGFVVIDFSLRQPPKPGDVLVVLRNNQKVAKVRITEPTRGSFVTADVIDGAVQVGDTIP